MSEATVNMGLAGNLLNGAQILARFQCVESKWIVLCVRRCPEREYVTWDCNAEGNAFSGHYFCEYDDAARDFYARLKRAMGVMS